jgi:hypothetical protein
MASIKPFLLQLAPSSVDFAFRGLVRRTTSTSYITDFVAGLVMQVAPDIRCSTLNVPETLRHQVSSVVLMLAIPREMLNRLQ